MGKTVAICQPNFLPWLGYFEMAHRADVYVMLDDVQYIRREWVNRNKISSYSEQGWQWLVVPVVNSARETTIKDTLVHNETAWGGRMSSTLRNIYGKAPYYEEYFEALEAVLLKRWDRLVDLNLAVMRLIYKFLGLADNLVMSSDLGVGSKKDDKLAEICQKLGADVYLANNGSKPYIESDKFHRRGIGFVFQDYQHPAYQVDKRPFVPYLSVADLLFWHGPDSLDIILKGREENWKSKIIYPDTENIKA